jgi:hypothetical protein
MRKFLAILTFSFVSFSAFAGSYQEELNAFFSLFESGKRAESVDRLYKTNQWVNQASDEVINLKSQLSSIDSMVGKYVGKELILTNNINDRFVHITYLALYERQPVRLEFQFYKPKNDWIIYSFSFDTDFDSDVKTASRAQAAMGK